MSTGTKLTRLTPEILARIDGGAGLQEVALYAGRHRTTEDVDTQLIRPAAFTPAVAPAEPDPTPAPHHRAPTGDRVGVFANIRRNLGKFRV